MKVSRSRGWIGAAVSLALTFGALSQAAKPAQAQALKPPQASRSASTQPPLPFEESVYLYNLAYDADLKSSAGAGGGAWVKYRAWLGVKSLGAESDPGWGAGDWWDCCQHVNWSAPWGAMQQRYGTTLPTVILGMGQMPGDPNTNDSWNQKLAWEDRQWQLEASDDPTLLGYFANYAKEVDDLGFKKVIIRLGYEFDGGWNPFGNLNAMSKMPGNYIASWRNIVTTVRANDPKHLIKFCWNPTDSNVQVWTQSFYPGDDYVDYVGIDTYDVSYHREYPVGPSQPTKAQQDAAWANSELPRINAFSDFARAHGKPIVIGEWGLWQLNDSNHPSGGDNPTYIQNMYNWLCDPKNHVAAACYFEAPSDGDSSLSGLFHPTSFPNARNEYLKLFGKAGTVSAPPKPTDLTAAQGNGQVTLTWNASVGIPSATYNVYRGATAGGEALTPIAKGVTASTYVSKGLRNDTPYYYKVLAANGAGASAASNEASATPTRLFNHLQNGGFEAGNLSAWSFWAGTNAGAAYAETLPTAHPHAGKWQYTNWSNSPYQLSLYQSVTLPNGSYTVSAWVKCSGGQSACQMEVSNFGGDKIVVPVAASSGWTQISTPVSVTNGTLQVGFYSSASANQWLGVDDVAVR